MWYICNKNIKFLLISEKKVPLWVTYSEMSLHNNIFPIMLTFSLFNYNLPLHKMLCHCYHSCYFSWSLKMLTLRASLGAQWIRIPLPRQGKQVRTLVWEDPTCRRATKPMHHNYWACALELTSHNYWAHVPQLLKPRHLEPVLCNKRSYHNEKPADCNKE